MPVVKQGRSQSPIDDAYTPRGRITEDKLPCFNTTQSQDSNFIQFMNQGRNKNTSER